MSGARAALLAVLLAWVPARAYEWTPVGGVTALGGLHSFDGRSRQFTGNADAVFAPAVVLNERWSLLPSVRGAYEGTRRLTDALGTATPAQQSAEARVGARGVWSDPASRWRLKPFWSYDLEWLRESAGEDWGQGLFDQRRIVIGAEVELAPDDDRSLRLSAAWFSARYPNYTTLESQAALNFGGRSLARELVGDRVLDRDGYQFSLAGETPLGARLVGAGHAAAVWSAFGRQPVVDQGGRLTPEKRADVLADAAASVRMPHEWNADLRALGAFEVGLAFDSSNQNGYDATRGRFLPGFYDFAEWRAEPSGTLIVGPARRPVTLTLKTGVKRRQYAHRPPQDETGAYGAGSLSATQWSWDLALAYPMARRLSVQAELGRAWSVSNQRFQQFYQYSWQATTALAGVRWDW